jgi:hypothetical protein
MKNHILSFISYAVLTLCFACSGNDPEPSQITINHTGEKWNITALEYNVVDQNFRNPSIKNGTTSNAGAFYFDGSKGSFDIKIDDIHKEDVFGLVSGTSDITITSIEQSVQGTSFSQNVIVLSGDKPSGSSMTLSGTITQQSLNGQFVLTGTFTLTKQ